jgi:hypothetical protein
VNPSSHWPAICRPAHRVLAISGFTFIKRPIIAVTRITDFIIKSKLSAEFVKYINVFDTEKADVLTAYNKNKHAINLKRNKLSFGSLYNLLIKELKILRTYFDAALAKK